MSAKAAGSIEVAFDEGTVRARLGLLCAEPRSSDGHWVLLIEGPSGQPVAMAHVGLAFDFPSAPITEAEEALRRAGYEYHNDVVTEPWSAVWKLSPVHA